MSGFTKVNLLEVENSAVSVEGLQEEGYVVIAGSRRILLDETQELQLWDVIRVAAEVARGFEAGPERLNLIAFGGPKPEYGDGIRATATWPTAE